MLLVLGTAMPGSTRGDWAPLGSWFVREPVMAAKLVGVEASFLTPILRASLSVLS